ncbi:cell adhesion molecule Dscam2-like [Haemaphysalis longicornis]
MYRYGMFVFCVLQLVVTAVEDSYALSEGRPKIKEFKFPGSLSPGDTAAVICELRKGSAGPFELSWQKDGIRVEPTTSLTVTSHKGGAVSALTIVDVSAQDSGNYTCVARNADGSDQFSAFLAVTGIPPCWLHCLIQGMTYTRLDLRLVNVKAVGLLKAQLEHLRSHRSSGVDKHRLVGHKGHSTRGRRQLHLRCFLWDCFGERDGTTNRVRYLATSICSIIAFGWLRVSFEFIALALTSELGWVEDFGSLVFGRRR